MRPWNRVIDPAVDYLAIQGNASDHSELQMYASPYFPQITELLHKLPPVILLMLKTNDCLRAVNNALMYASPYFPQITKLLHKLPRVILIMLKTNDCLRAVKRIGTKTICGVFLYYRKSFFGGTNRGEGVTCQFPL